MAAHEIRVLGNRISVVKTAQVQWDEWIATGTFLGKRIEARAANEPGVLENWKLKAPDSTVDREWISPRKMLDYYVDFADPAALNNPA